MNVWHVTAGGVGLEVNAWASRVGLVAVRIGTVPAAGRVGGNPVEGIRVESGAPEELRALGAALGQYLAGAPLEWDGPLDLRGTTEFHQTVFAVVRGIPHGEIRSYRDVAAASGRPAAVRAVGVALGRNPFPIVVPCHRVTRVGGELGGYSAGPEVKRRLLALEAGQIELGLEGTP